MPDATVTDINEYRARKKDTVDYFEFYEDDDILRRIKILRWRENNELKEGSLVYKLSFPNGFNPDTDTRDNLQAFLDEGHRRGII